MKEEDWELLQKHFGLSLVIYLKQKWEYQQKLKKLFEIKN